MNKNRISKRISNAKGLTPSLSKTKAGPSSERSAELIYRDVLEKIMYPLLGKKITFGRDLARAGIKLFGKNFLGAFASDRISEIGNPNVRLGVNDDGSPTTNNNINKKSHLYAIANLDNSSMPGSHWIGLAFDVNSKKIWVYDSFGRKTSEIIPSLVQRYGNKLKQVDDDAEQLVSQDDCGARTMAWLYVFDRYGASTAKLI